MVTESEFVHERRGLESLRGLLPDSAPPGLVEPSPRTAVTSARSASLSSPPGRVCLIELEDWHGSVTSKNGSWVQTTRNGHRRTHSNPLHLANKIGCPRCSSAGTCNRPWPALPEPASAP